MNFASGKHRVSYRIGAAPGGVACCVCRFATPEEVVIQGRGGGFVFGAGEAKGVMTLL